MAEQRLWSKDKPEYDLTKRYFPSFTTNYRQVANPLNYRSQLQDQDSLQFFSSSNSIPPICQSLPLITARRQNREAGQIYASANFEYTYEHHWPRDEAKNAFGKIKLRSKSTKKVVSKDNTMYTWIERSQAFSFESSPGVVEDKVKYCQHSPFLDKSVDEIRQAARQSVIREALEEQQSMSSTLHAKEGNGTSTKYETPNKSSPSTSKEKSCNVKSLMLFVIFVFVIWQVHLLNNRLGQKISMEKLAVDITLKVQSALIGQHIAAEVIESSFHNALVNNNTKVVTLLMVGPSGNGKTFGGRILQNILTSNGFAISRTSNDLHRINVSHACEQWGSYQNLAIVIDDVSHNFQDEWRSGDLIMRSKHCSNFNKIVVILVSSVFSEEIKQYMFTQCKFKEDRLKIKSKDVMKYISKSKGVSVNFESSDDRHVILPMIFLPLDIDHLEICILRALSLRGVSQERKSLISKEVVELMEFYPQCGMKYPEFGCKLVGSRVDYIVKNRFDLLKFI